MYRRTTYSPTHRRMLELLSDGERHTSEELVSCLWDDMGAKRNVHYHICTLRKILPQGELIVCETAYCKSYYRHVLHLSSRAQLNGTTIEKPAPPPGIKA